MSFNGSGTFNINTAGQPVVTGTVISSSVFNALTADLATGLSTCITKDGQTTVTANIPMNSFKFTGLAAGTAATDSVRLGQIQAGAATLITVTGTNTYSGTMTPALSAYAAGNTFTFLVPNTNTTSCTLNIDGLGAKSITRDGTTALVAGDLIANSEVVVVYDGTQFQVLNSNSKTNFNLSGTLTVAGNTTLSGGTANGVAYLNGSKVLTTGSALVFDGTNVGIGTTSPSTVGVSGYTRLVLGAGGSATDGLTIVPSGTGGVQFTDAANVKKGYLQWDSSTGALAFGTAATERMRIDSSGNVGIGTSSPSEKLSVAGNTTADIYKLRSNTSVPASTDAFVFRPADNTLAFGTASSERVRIDSSGNVTINAPSSGTSLAVTAVSGGIGLSLGGTALACLSNFTTGAYHTWQYNGTSLGDIGTANNTFSGGSTSDFGVTSRSGNLVFGTGSTERARIDTSGNLLVGTTSASFNSSNSTFFYPTTGYWIVNHANGTSTGTRYIGFGYNTGEIGSITQNGTTGVLYNITSDYRLKEFVAPITNAGERIDALNPVEFNWKSDGSRARGFFAHEFQQVYASSVTGEKDAVDEDGNPVYQKMQASTAEVIADLVAEIKSLRQRVAQLEVK